MGRRLAAVHGATVGRPELARRFAASTVFAVMRIDPFFGTLARAHPDRVEAIARIRDELVGTGRVVIHGDVTPKNVLCSPPGPMLIDAECATWGDPAFDLALCSAHLLLKCRWNAARSSEYLACFDALVATYAGGVDWEDAGGLD